MADAFIRVAPDSTGKKMQTYENLIGADSVHAEAVVLVDQFGVPIATGLTDAQLRASPVPFVGTRPIVATFSPTFFKNLGANATLNVKASPGNVFSLSCYNANAAARFIQLHNTATTPAGSAVPIFSFFVPPSGQIIIGTDFFTNEGCNFATGIAFGFSTARDIYTAATAGDQSTWIQYK